MTPPPPKRPQLSAAELKLQDGVRAALLALPTGFSFRHQVSGVAATDLFHLNSLLGAGIEIEVVRTLNAMRALWDPDNEWLDYRFERSTQAFPDVRLVRRGAGSSSPDIAIGIELKGWWLFSKEAEPSLRFKVAPAACASHDLVCVVPWHLTDAVAGEAVVVEPWVESARYSALWRDHWWQYIRAAKIGDSGIDYPKGAQPYPEKADRVLAVPRYDGGGNFGRLPRCSPLMDDFLDVALDTPVLGIPARDWVKFLKIHTDASEVEKVTAEMQAMLDKSKRGLARDHAERILENLRQASALLDD